MKAFGLRSDLSLMAQKITMLREQSDGTMVQGGVATGSYWQEGDVWYLVTNWHNITGCNPITEKALSDTGFLPTHVEISILCDNATLDNSLPSGVSLKAWRRVSIPLYDFNGPRWFEHPVHGRVVDVVALPAFTTKGLSFSIRSRPINTYGSWFDIRLQPGDDAFVLGYPGALDGGHHLPLWKRASLATEPELDWNGLPQLLIDTATRKGMSGAPVIAISNGYNIPAEGEIKDAMFGRVEKFVGIYSGRTDDDPLGVQIGRVWKEAAIIQLMNIKAKGHNPLNW